MRFGLSDETLALIQKTCAEFPDLAQVIIFGSRAMGNFKPGSDVDLALIGTNGALAPTTRTTLSAKLNEELPLPYRFDIIDTAEITHEPLREHIKQYGRVLWQR